MIRGGDGIARLAAHGADARLANADDDAAAGSMAPPALLPFPVSVRCRRRSLAIHAKACRSLCALVAGYFQDTLLSRVDLHDAVGRRTFIG